MSDTSPNANQSDPMTIQAITGRLAEEAGWKKTTVNVDGMTISIHPFRPDSIDDAIRGVPEGMAWLVSSNRATVWVPGRSFIDGNSFTHCDGKNAAENLYFAIAKARGWM